MKTKYVISAAFCAALVVLTSCSLMPKKSSHVKHTPDFFSASAEEPDPFAVPSSLPEHYSKIEFPEYKYVAPYPKDYRVKIADGITGYIVSDTTLPLVDFSVYFEESNLPLVLKDEAAFEMVGSMIRRGGGGGITAHALDPA